jgi:hypothetical protein
MVAGSGRDDEPVFEWANKFAKEVRVGTGHTQANATTTGVAGKYPDNLINHRSDTCPAGVVTALQKLGTISVAEST